MKRFRWDRSQRRRSVHRMKEKQESNESVDWIDDARGCSYFTSLPLVTVINVGMMHDVDRVIDHTPQFAINQTMDESQSIALCTF